MKVLTKKQVLDRLNRWVAGYISHAAAARAAGVTAAQMSDALGDKIAVPEKLLKKLKIQRTPLYTVNVKDAYLDKTMQL